MDALSELIQKWETDYNTKFVLETPRIIVKLN